jgi:serine/threonine-protein kinase
MLTGKRTFDGDDVSDILGAVLIREPNWTQLSPTLPPGIRNVLRLCLEKNFRNRRGSAADVRLDIELALKEPAAVVQTIAPQAKRPMMSRVLPAALAAVGLALIVALVAWTLKPNAATQPVVRFSFVLPDDQAFTNAGRPVVVWAPDGSRFVYVANTRLYLRTLGESASRMIQGSQDNQGVLNPVFSPDGQSLAFFSLADKTLKRIAVTGGTAVTIGAVDAPFGMSWGADDEILVGQGPKGIVRISAKGGQPQPLITLQSNEIAHVSELLPGGDAVLFSVAKSIEADRWDKGQVVVQSLKSGERKILVEGGRAARYLPTGHLIYAVGKTLMAAPFDVKRLLITGSAVALVDGVLVAGNSGASQFSIASNGSLLYVPASDDKFVNTLALVDREGKAKPLSLPPGGYTRPRISQNGRQIAFHTVEEKADQQNVWIYDLDGKTSMRQLTFAGKNLNPIWSPDGQRILFQSDRDGDLGLFIQRADGAGAAERVTKPDGDYYSHVPDSWSPDGDTFLFTKGKGSDSAVWSYSFRDQQATLFADAALWQQSASFSPDGRWVAYMSEEKGRNVFVEPFPRTGAKFQLKDSATHPIWSPDGKELFFMSNLSNGQLYAVSVRTQPSFAFGIPVPLPIKGFIQTAGGLQNYDVTPDGKQFLVVMPPANTTEKGAGPQVQVVLNWFEELRQRVPVR